MDVNDHRRSLTIASSAPSAGAAHVRELFSGRLGHYFSIDSANYATTISYDANMVRPFPPPPRSYTMASVEALKHERKEGKKLSKTRTFLSAVVGKLTKSKQRKKKKKGDDSHRFHCHVDGCQLEERPRQPSPPPLPGRAENHANEITTESSSESLIDSNDEEDEEEEGEDENDGTNDDGDDDDDGTNNDDTLPSFPPPSPLSPLPPPVPPRPASLANRLDLLPPSTPTMYSSIDLTDSGPVTPSSVFSGGHFPPPVPPRRSQSAIDPPVPPPRRLPLFNPRRRHSYGNDSLYALPVEEMRRRARLLTAIHEDESTMFPRQRASSFDASALLRHDYELPNWRRFSVGGHTYVSINGSIVRAVGAFSDASSLKSFETESVGSELPPSVSRSGSYCRDRKLRHRRSRSCDDLRIEEKAQAERESELLESVVQDMSDNVQEWFRTASFREEEERDEVNEDGAELPLKSEAAAAAAGGEGVLLLDPDLLLAELSIKEDHFRNSFFESAISLDSQPKRNRDDTVSRLGGGGGIQYSPLAVYLILFILGGERASRRRGIASKVDARA